MTSDIDSIAGLSAIQRGVLDSLAEGVALVRARDGVILHVNPAFLEWSGRRASEVVRRLYCDPLGASDPEGSAEHDDGTGRMSLVESVRRVGLHGLHPERDRDRLEAIAASLEIAGGWRGVVPCALEDGAPRSCELRFSMLELSGRDPAWLVSHSAVPDAGPETDDLAFYREKLRFLAMQIALASERERRQIASSLHDKVSQSLALARITLGQIEEDELPSPARKQLREARSLLEQTIQGTRSMMFELSPPVLYELGFEAAVEWLADRFREETGMDCTVQSDSRHKPLGSEMEIILFRAVRELMENVRRHSGAREARIVLQGSESVLRVRVEDDGKGLDPGVLADRNNTSGRFGLFGIREQLALLGGELKIAGSDLGGALLTLIAPLNLQEKPDHAEDHRPAR